MLLPHTRLSRRLDPLLGHIGRLTGWLWMVLLLTIVGNVMMRYPAAAEGRRMLKDLERLLKASSVG